MPKKMTDDLGKELATLRRKVDALASGSRLDHASLDGTTLYLKGNDQLGRIGLQPDGSVGYVPVKSQPPPQPTAPILTAGEQAGTCQVKWDGGTFDGRSVPAVFGHCEIWAELVGDEWDPTVAPGESAERVGSIRDRKGGEVTVALPQAGVWAVWLRLMGADRETAGPWGPVATVEITPLVDVEAIQDAIDDANERIEQAEIDLAAGMAEREAEIEYLRLVRLPQLQDDLAAGLSGVHAAAEALAEAARDDAVNQAASNAQSEYDRLQEIAERALSRAGDNVLEDPSFETDYWFDLLPRGTRTLTPTSVRRTGDQAMEISDGNNSFLWFDTLDVEEGESWRFTIWYRTSGLSSSGNTQLLIRDESSGTTLEESSSFDVSENEFRRAVVTYTVPPGVVELTPTLIPRFSGGTMIVDDVSFQEVGAAAEALNLAEIARQEASAAHIAAGEAVDVAANAYDAAQAKSTIHWSLSAPSGTAESTDDVWWQYELRNGRRVVIGQWFWDSGVWRETEIAEEWLPLVNIGTGTYGDMSGDRLTANTVETRHLFVGNRDDLIPEEWFGENAAGHYLYSTNQNYSDNFSVNQFTADNPSLGATSFNPVTLHGRRGWQIAGSSSFTTEALRTGPGKGIPVTPGEKFALQVWVRDLADSSLLEWRFGFFRKDGSEGTPLGQMVRLNLRGIVHDEGDTEGETFSFEVPDLGWGDMYMVPSLRHNGGSGSGMRTIMEPKLRKTVGGVLIDENGVKARNVDTEEFFAAQAVIDKIWTDIVYSRLIMSEGIITEDMIATGSITTPKLTVTEEMVANIASLIHIEAGSLASNDIESMRIVSALIESSVIEGRDAQGNLTYRLDGMDNLLQGTLHAGLDANLGITMDYRLTEVPDDWPDEEDDDDSSSEYIVTPEMEFRSDFNYDVLPKVFVDTGGRLNIDPGKLGGAPRSQMRVWRGIETQRLDAVRFQVNTSNPNTPGGMFRDGDRTRLFGRAPDWSAPSGMFTHGFLGPYNVGSGRYRGAMGYTQPAETGTRRPIVSGHMSQTSIDNWRECVATSGAPSASGFSFTLVSESTSVNMYMNYTATWL